jgi:ABC-type transport system substrate-binding protein
LPSSGAASKGGVALTDKLIYPRSDPARALAATRIASQAAAAGILLTPTALGDTDFGAALQSGSFEVALTAGGLGADPDDSITLGCDQAPPQNPAGLNAAGFCDPVLDALLTSERAVPVTSTTSMEAQRRPIFDRIERLLAADVPFIPLWTDTRWLAINTTVGGVGHVGAQLDDNLNSAFYAGLFLTG